MGVGSEGACCIEVGGEASVGGAVLCLGLEVLRFTFFPFTVFFLTIFFFVLVKTFTTRQLFADYK